MDVETFNSTIYHGDTHLEEVNIFPMYEDSNLLNAVKEVIKISHLSPTSERCPPLVVIHTIMSSPIFIKVEFKEQELQSEESPLKKLYNTCLEEAKTAIIPITGKEMHLVAMLSRNMHDQMPCFGGYNASSGMYNSCLEMLNLRCLAIVFDLDETLIVANTLSSFEDRIDALHCKIGTEVDSEHVSGMAADLKRYQEDNEILKQYADNGKVIKD